MRWMGVVVNRWPKDAVASWITPEGLTKSSLSQNVLFSSLGSSMPVLLVKPKFSQYS